MRRLVIAAAVTALSAGAVAPALAGGPDLPKVPTNCQEFNDLLGIDNVRECGDPDPGARSGPPEVPVGVHVNQDGSVCVGISYQVPQCTPPLD